MRLPTSEEKQQLLDYVVGSKYNNPSKEEIQDEKECIENIWICVFDDYITDCPGYAGRVMVVVWGGSPSFTETFIWDKVAVWNSGVPKWSEPILTKVEVEI